MLCVHWTGSTDVWFGKEGEFWNWDIETFADVQVDYSTFFVMPLGVHCTASCSDISFLYPNIR